MEKRKKASDYPQELLDLFDLYVHGDLDRRDFLDRAKKFATGAVTALAICGRVCVPTTPGRNRFPKMITALKRSIRPYLRRRGTAASAVILSVRPRRPASFRACLSSTRIAD